MKSWKWYAKQLKKNPPFRLRGDTQLGKPLNKTDHKRIRKARKFEKKNGFAFEDCWNLNVATAIFLYPRLAFLRDNHHSVPTIFAKQFETIEEADKEWTKILNRMTKGFYIYAIKEDYEYTESDMQLIDEAKTLFITYFSSLWD